MAIELRLEQIDSELPRFCIAQDGRLLVDEPMGCGEMRRRAMALGRELGLPVVEVAASGERTELHRPPAMSRGPGGLPAADDPLVAWPEACPMGESPAAG